MDVLVIFVVVFVEVGGIDVDCFVVYIDVQMGDCLIIVQWLQQMLILGEDWLLGQQCIVVMFWCIYWIGGYEYVFVVELVGQLLCLVVYVVLLDYFLQGNCIWLQVFEFGQDGVVVVWLVFVVVMQVEGYYVYVWCVGDVSCCCGGWYGCYYGIW